MKKMIIDGNEACSNIAYNFIEVAGIYPITPSSNMAELVDKWSVEGRTNFFNDKVSVYEMQSEKGAIGLVHGALQTGAMASTFTSSQGLLLMIPNMYKIAGEMLPCVINVAARTVATHALSILGDHSDIYAARQTGFAFISASSVQGVNDLTAVSYLSSLEGRIPFVNFFDGFRTSHELQKITVLEKEDLMPLVNNKYIESFRKRAMDIDNPTTRGTNQSDQIYFQTMEARNKYYEALPDIVNSYMEKINKITNKDYKPFNYYGAKNADRVIVAMGSICETIKETIDCLNFMGEKVGLVEVHLYRPFSKKYFLNVLPKSVKKVAVLDRTKEPGANGEPLYLDVCEILKDTKIKVVGGRYGISSKNTNPNHIESVFNFLKGKNLHTFTIGIDDDVTNLSLEETSTIFDFKNKEILIYGFGSDGMVTASKDILKIIGEVTDNYVQGYFEYDSKKSNGVTKSHLRISDKEIRSTYYVNSPSLVVCTKDSYLKKYDVLKGIKENSIFVLNTARKEDELSEILSSDFINTLKKKNIDFYIINANKISALNNIPNKISVIMEMVIFRVLNVLDADLVYEKIVERIEQNFSKKGRDVIEDNINALRDALSNIHKVDISMLSPKLENIKINKGVFSYLDHLEGDSLKVSDVLDVADGVFQGDLSKYEKRGMSNRLPCYDKEKCIMCNLCSFVCPHAVIRAHLLDENDEGASPNEVLEDLLDAKVKNKNLKYTLSFSTLDCTGCSICSLVCPTKAITMKDKEETTTKELVKYDYLKNVKERQEFAKNTVKGLGFVKPNFRFHGACAGCGETTYLKILTQLFDNLMIANATGCSSIYGASLPSVPYNVPWANSLFEDNAEFGMGMRTTDKFMKEKIKNILKENIEKLSDNNKSLALEYMNSYSKEVSYRFYESFDFNELEVLKPLKSFIKDKSIWIVGGDGWAYDIGFDGIDHVLASKEDVNILVLDTEVYSNTGGQASKSTRSGAVAKFASDGKKTSKKDLARFALMYDDVYVATVSLGANYNQTIKAFVEANEHKGPSIIIAYSPCIAHGIKKGMSNTIEKEKEVVSSGYFPLFRYKDSKIIIDSKSDFSKYDDMFLEEARYSVLGKKDLQEKNKINAKKRLAYYEEFLNKIKED